MHTAAAEHYRMSFKFNSQSYKHSLLSLNRYASYFQTQHKSQGPQSTGLSAQQLVRMVLYTATLKDYHYKPALHDE